MRRAGLTLAVLLCLVALGFAQDWIYPVQVYSGDRTNLQTVHFGVDYRASDCFDTLGLDVPFIPSPWGFGAYFVPPCTDGLPEGIEFLSQDVRSSSVSENPAPEWIIRVDDFSSGDRLIVWDSEALPVFVDTGDTGGELMRTTALAESMWIGQRTAGAPEAPTEWVDMASTDSFLFSAGNEVVIHTVMLGAVDHNPPEVSNVYPPDSSTVQRNDSLHFDITDDVSGVDLTSLSVQLTVDGTPTDITGDLILTAIPSGYHCYYDYPGLYPGDVDVCVSVDAQDLYSTPHVMETYEWCFHTVDTVVGDCDPPYFDSWSISNGDTILSSESIVFAIIDGPNAGVDLSSVSIEIDGVDWTGACFFMRLGVNYDYQVTVPPMPLSGWETGTTHQLVVNAADMAVPPPCGPNYATPETIVFYVSLDSLSPWTMAIDVNDEVGPTSHLFFGMDFDGSDGYDPELDVQIPVAPPGFYAYFPLSDPTYPDVDMLSTDIRELPEGPGVRYWYINYAGETGTNSVTWEPTAVPELPGSTYFLELYVGHGPDEGSISWTDMRGSSSMPFSSGEVVMLKAQVRIPDTYIGPYITNLDPPAGAMNVPLDKDIEFDIRDDVGIDASSIVVRLDGVVQTYELVDTFVNGYRVRCDPGYLTPVHTYSVNVLADDLDMETHSLDTTYQFSTATICGPLFQLSITAYDSSASDVRDFVTTLGVDTLATSGYDPDLDAIPPPPPSFYVYINNPEDPMWQYSTDIRNNCPTSEWHIYLGNVSGEAQWLEWNPLLIPYHEYWRLKVAVSSGPMPDYETNPELYQDMRDFSRIDISAGDTAFVVWKTWDTTNYGCIAGTITDAITSSPVVGALVSVLGSEDNTDDAGQYTICNIPYGDYDVTVSMDGYYDTTITVTIDADTVTLDVALLPYCYTVSGTTFVDGVPTGGVHVIIGPMDAYSDPTYSLCLTPGTYELRAEYGGCYPDVVDTITITDSDIDYPIYMVPGNFNITGTVSLLPGGEPAEGASITVDGSPVATVDSLGNYAISVGCDVHEICATYLGYDDTCVSVFVDDDMVLDFGLSPGAVEVCVNVTDGVGAAVEGALVEMPPYTALTTNSSGTACFSDVDWGDYDITVSMEHYATAGTTITVPEVVDVDITLYECCPVADLSGDFTPTARPLSEALHTALTWTAPTCDLTPVLYHIYRDDVEIDTTSTPGYDDYSVEDGESYSYYITVEYEECESEASNTADVDIAVTADPNDILLIDFDNGAGYSEDMEALLDNILAGTTHDYTTTLQDEDITLGSKYDLDDYQQVIVVLGIRGDASDEVMPTAMLDALADYAGCVYVEGPDFAYDYDGTEFIDMFRFSATEGNPSSVGNVSTVIMDSAFFADEWIMDYPFGTDADHYVDALTPLAGALSILYANDDSFTVGVSYGNKIYTSIFITELQVGTDDVGGRILGGILWACDIDNVNITEHPNVKPQRFSLSAAPNPFNAACEITFDLPSEALVDVTVFDIGGNKVATLYHGWLGQARYTANWDASDVASGTYVIKLEAGKFTASTKVTLVK